MAINSNCMSRNAEGILMCGGVIGFGLLHPVIGLLAQPILAIKAIYHGVMLNRAWHRSENKAGVAMLQDTLNENPLTPKYKSKVTVFTQEDLPRLEAELERIDCEDKLWDTLRWMRGLAKCIIPILGLVWAMCTELTGGGSMNLGCDGCMDHEGHWSNREAINFHIQKVKDELKNKKIENLT